MIDLADLACAVDDAIIRYKARGYDGGEPGIPFDLREILQHSAGLDDLRGKLQAYADHLRSFWAMDEIAEEIRDLAYGEPVP